MLLLTPVCRQTVAEGRTLRGCYKVPLIQRKTSLIDLESKSHDGEFKREDMRFYNDMHLSKFGHEVLAQELVRLLAEER